MHSHKSPRTPLLESLGTPQTCLPLWVLRLLANSLEPALSWLVSPCMLVASPSRGNGERGGCKKSINCFPACVHRQLGGGGDSDVLIAQLASDARLQCVSGVTNSAASDNGLLENLNRTL